MQRAGLSPCGHDYLAGVTITDPGVVTTGAGVVTTAGAGVTTAGTVATTGAGSTATDRL